MDVNCPYCNKGIDLNHDDGAHYDEDRRESAYCEDCDKYFMVSASVLWFYESEAASCLNDDKHDFQITTTYPKEYSRMRCSMCDEERQPTPQERELYKLDIK